MEFTFLNFNIIKRYNIFTSLLYTKKETYIL